MASIRPMILILRLEDVGADGRLMCKYDEEIQINEC